MQIVSEFAVARPREEVWEALMDPSVLLESIPGCEELQQIDQDHFRARLVTSIAHIKFSAAVEAAITERIPPGSMKAVIQGEDKRLASGVRVDAALDLHEEGPDRTRLSYVLVVALRGRLGRMGEPIFQRKSREMEAEFTRRFRARIEARAV